LPGSDAFVRGLAATVTTVFAPQRTIFDPNLG
jgi:hypothetical protein